MNRETSKKPPTSHEAERSVLGAMILNPEAIEVSTGILGDLPDPFYFKNHRDIYAAIVALHRDGKPADFITLQAQLGEEVSDRIGAVYIAELTDAVPTSANADYYAKIVLDCHLRRRMIFDCERALAHLYDQSKPILEIRKELEAASFFGVSTRAGSKPEHISGLVKAEVGRLMAVGSGEIGRGIKTGLGNIDKIMLPMQPGNYIILAARTSVGKTTLACNVALNAAVEGVGVLIFSMEMTKLAITNKLIQIDSGVDMAQIEMDSRITEYQKRDIKVSAEKIEKLNIVIDEESGISPGQLRAKARAVCAKEDIGLIIVDYIGLMRIPKLETDLVTTLTIASADMKAMAKELNVPVLVLAQINRDAAEARPDLHNLRNCGSLEQDCDVAILLDRPNRKEYPNHVTAIIAKQRIGPCSDAALYFRRDEQKFYDADGNGGQAERPQKKYTRTRREPEPEPVNCQIEYDYLEEDDTPF